MLARLLTSAALVAPALLAAGCSCNDQNFSPIDYEDLGSDYGKWLSMDVAPDGSPVIAYYDVTMGGLGFAIGDIQPDRSVKWRHEEVDGYPDTTGLDTGDVGQFASMKVAPDGTVWIAYKGMNTLRVAHRENGVWSWQIADAGEGMAPDVGLWASLALDSEQRPVVAHQDAATGTLRVARMNDGSWTAAKVHEGQAWDGVDAEGAPLHREANVGMYARLLIDGDTEYIAFHDAAQQDLQLLEGFPGAYTTTVVHHVDGGNLGHWPSLLLDGDTLHVAYEDRANGDLLVATREGAGGFDVEVADDGEFAGSDTELFKDGDKLSVLYFEGRHNDMMLAERDDDGWTTEALGGDDRAVGFFNEVVATEEEHYAASYDYTNKTLYWRPL